MSDVRVHFEGVKALQDVDLELDDGEILGLIGPNGAGKTTLVNVLTGYQRPLTGKVLFSGDDVTGMAPHRLTRLGLARTFQSVRLFNGLTALENVAVAALGVGLPRAAARQRAVSVLDRVGLIEKANNDARELSHGDARRLGIARALATRPRFLLLDEPAAGLDEAESRQLVETIRSIRDELACGVLVIEHDMSVIMALCERIQVLDYGRTLAIGTPEEVRNNADVLEAYLGKRKAS